MRSFKTYVSVLPALLLPLSGCASNQRLAAKAISYHTYFEASYEAKCVKVTGPSVCKDCQMLLNDSLWKVKTANSTYKLGAMPKKELDELKKLVADLEVTCP